MTPHYYNAIVGESQKISQFTALLTIRVPRLSPKTIITPQLLFTLPIFPTINYLRVLLNNDICTTHTSVAFHLPLHNPFAHIQRIQITYSSHFLSLQTPTISPTPYNPLHISTFTPSIASPCGLMDKAFPSGGRDCGFKSHLGLSFSFIIPYYFTIPILSSMNYIK